MTIAIIVALIYFIIKNDSLTQENRQLKSKLNNKTLPINYCPKCGFNLKSKMNIEVPKPKVNSNNYKDISEPQANFNNYETISESKMKQSIKVKQHSEQEIKNTIILSIGAILVILSAIVFLATTWNTSINITKTLVIALMFFVFLGSSYIADKYLKIKQTSKIFLYIAFSYLPLVFFSVSLFELLGHYLSFFGPGKYVYLALSTIVLSLIYYYFMVRKKDIFFAIGSIIFQVLSVILFILIYTTNINTILIGISIYILIFNIFYVQKKYYYNENTHLKIKQTLTVALLFITFYIPFIFQEISPIDVSYILLLISLYFNIYYLLSENSKEKDIFNIVSPIMILFISINIATLINQGFETYQLMIIIGIIINYLKELLVSKKLSIENYTINSIALLILYLYSFTQESLIPSYCLLLIYILMTTYQKIISNNNNFNYIISIATNIAIIDIIFSFSINTLVLPIVYLLIFILNSIIKENELIESFQETSILFTIIGFIINIYTNSSQYIMLMIFSIIITLTYFIYYLNKKEILFKYISYGWLIVACYYIVTTISPNSEYLIYVFSLSSIITFIVDKYLSPKNHNEYEFLIMEFIICFICLTFTKSPLAIIIYPIIIVFFILHNKECKKTDYLNIIPIASFYLYIINNNYINEINYYTLISYSIPAILLIYLFISEKKEYILISLISVFLAIIAFPHNIYIVTISLLLCALTYYNVDAERKDIYLSSIYILMTILVKNLIHDFNLENITVLNIGIYIVPLLLITRTILKKNNNEYKSIEYIGLVIIYSLAIIKYADELDGMIFVFLLLVLTIVSYYKKAGPVFLTSIAYILINILILTRVFWLSLPWWVYILLVGSTLIAFAIRNELSEKNKKESIIKEVAKKIDS